MSQIIRSYNSVFNLQRRNVVLDEFVSPLLRVPKDPFSDYAQFVMKNPNPIESGLGTEAIVEAAGPDCIVPGQITSIKLLGLKASDYLDRAEYDSGNNAEDVKAQSLMHQLLNNPILQATCSLPFDEAKLWQGQNGPELNQQIQNQFKYISALMDCVGCEKCCLWGKLQVLGLGTTLNILLSVNSQMTQLNGNLLRMQEPGVAMCRGSLVLVKGGSSIIACQRS